MDVGAIMPTRGRYQTLVGTRHSHGMSDAEHDGFVDLFFMVPHLLEEHRQLMTQRETLWDERPVRSRIEHICHAR